MLRLVVAAVLILPLIGCASIFGPETYLYDQKIETPTLEKLTVCAGDNCAKRHDVHLTEADHDKLRSFFDPATNDPATEREEMKRAIAWLEHRVGVGDKRPPVDELEGQNVKEVFWNYHSCIDDTSNTTNVSS